MQDSTQTGTDVSAAAAVALDAANRDAASRQAEAQRFIFGHNERQVGDWEGIEANPGEA